MNSLYAIRNAYLPDGSWVGCFLDEDTAKSWLKKAGHDLAKCEISTRRPETKRRGETPPPPTGP